MPITDDIVCIGPKGDKLCYILKNGLRSKKDVDDIIERYLGEAKLNHPAGGIMTKEGLERMGWVTVFCVENGCFWASDAQEC